MQPHDDTRLRHMLDSAREAVEFVTGKSRNLPNLVNPAYAISRAADLQTLETK